jgi:hypothetical protein
METMNLRSPTSRGRLGAAWVAVALTLALGGCGLFNPEDPPPPGGTGQLHKPSLQTPDSALYCVIAGIATKTAQLYEFILPDTTLDGTDFHAFFDPQDLADYAQTGTPPPSDWIAKDEKTFISQYMTFVPVATYQAIFTPDENRADFFGADETIYYRHYRISFGTPPQFIGVGLADLYFRRVGVNQEWKMIRWVDRRDTTVFNLRTIGRQRLGPVSTSAN